VVFPLETLPPPGDPNAGVVYLRNKLSEEVTHLKNDNLSLKQEIKNLHSLIEPPSRPSSQCIAREPCILPAAMSYKDAAIIQHEPLDAAPDQALPVVRKPAGTTLAELSYRDVAAARISPSGSTVLPDAEGFRTVTYKRMAPASTPPVGTAAVKNVIQRRQPLIGVRNSLSLPVITKNERSKALFVSRLSPEVTADDVHRSLKEQLSLKKVGLHQTKN
jgi:hypothetical protein